MAMMMVVVVIISFFTFVVSLYKNPCVLVSAVFCGTFLSAGIDTFICIHGLPFFLIMIMMMMILLLLLLLLLLIIIIIIIMVNEKCNL